MLALLAVTVLTQSPPLPSALYRGAAEANAVVEVELPLITTEPAEPRWTRAWTQPKVLGVVASRGPVDAPPARALAMFPVIRSCLQRTNHRLAVKVLLLLRGNEVVPLPYAQLGLGLESTPGYAELKTALVAFFGWRAKDAGPARAALASTNPWLRHLAAEHLVQLGQGAALDEAWGASGTPERTQAEAAAVVAPNCKR